MRGTGCFGLVFAIIATSISLTGAALADRRVALVVVVAKESKVDSISLRQLRRIYNGDNPSRAHRPFNCPARSQVRVAFDKKVLGLSPSAIGRYWIDRKIRGERGAPRSLQSSLQVAKIVARFPGAIGYMRADTMPSWVKPLKVAGKSYTDENYPLYIRVP